MKEKGELIVLGHATIGTTIQHALALKGIEYEVIIIDEASKIGIDEARPGYDRSARSFCSLLNNQLTITSLEIEALNCFEANKTAKEIAEARKSKFYDHYYKKRKL